MYIALARELVLAALITSRCARGIVHAGRGTAAGEAVAVVPKAT